MRAGAWLAVRNGDLGAVAAATAIIGQPIRTMPTPDTTDWQSIRAAAGGDAAKKDEFVARYQGLIRSRLLGSMRQGFVAADVDDAVQEVFVECFRHGGVLASAHPDRIRGFRAFLHGVVDNVARRMTERGAVRNKHVADVDLETVPIPADMGTPSQQMDRDWALRMLRAAAGRMRERAAQLSQGAWRRVELLELRFQRGMPIRAIAEQWQVDAAVVHHQYAKAREEFRLALLHTLAAGRSLSVSAVQAECEQLLQLLTPR